MSEIAIESAMLRLLYRLVRPFRWVIPPLTLVAAAAVIVFGHRLGMRMYQDDPGCYPQIFDCTTHTLLSAWNAWLTPVGIALVLICLGALVIAVYDVPGYMFIAPITVPVVLYAYKHGYRFGQGKLNKFVENAAYPIGKFGYLVAAAMFVGGFLADIVVAGLGYSF